MSNDIRLSSPSENGSEFSIMNLQPDSTNGDVASCDEDSEPNVQQPNVQPNEVQQDETVVSITSIAENLKEQVNEPYAPYMFNEFPRPFLVEQSDRNAGNIDKEADVLPFVDLQSVLSSGYEAAVNGSINGSTKAWFGEVTSIMEAVLGKNVMEDDAHKVFDKMSELTSMKQNDKVDGLEELVSSVVRLPRVLDCGSEVTEVSSFHISSKSMFEEVSKFADIKNHELDVDFWVDGILMFIFDPGGHSSLHMGRNLFEFKHCFILFQTLYMFDKLPKSHTLLDYASKLQNNCQTPSYHSKRKLRYVFNWYAASENHNGEKFDY